MIIEMQIFLTAAAFILFILGSIKKHDEITADEQKSIRTSNAFPPMLMLLSVILFFILAVSSFDITRVFCDTVTTQTIANDEAHVMTNYTNDYLCTSNSSNDTALSIIYIMLGAISLIIFIYDTFFAMKG